MVVFVQAFPVHYFMSLQISLQRVEKKNLTENDSICRTSCKFSIPLYYYYYYYHYSIFRSNKHPLGTVRILPLSLNGTATLLIYKGVSEQHEGSLLMCLHVIKHKIWDEFVTANMSRQHGDLISAQLVGRSPTSPSAGISLKVQWGLQQSLVVNTTSWAQVWLTNASFGNLSAIKNKQQIVFQPIHSPMMRCSMTQGEDCPNTINQYHQALYANIWPIPLLQVTSNKKIIICTCSNSYYFQIVRILTTGI